MSGASQQPSTPAASGRGTRWRLLGLLGLVMAVALAAGAGWAVSRSGQTGPDRSSPFEHVHGLGVNPADGALYAATHDGLYRVPVAGDPVRVADHVQDFMGFTIAGPDRFLASGHPGPDGDGPSSVGLIESTDTGLTWTTRSLPGQADFHALDAAAGSVYGYDAATARVMVSSDGQVWSSTPLDGVADLAVDPTNPRQVLATTAQGVARSRDHGRTFMGAAGPVLLLLDWADDGTLVGVSPQGLIQSSRDAGQTWQPRGELGSPPEALAADADIVHVAVGGRILSSTDGGQTFTVRGQA